jgi:hypothetical protein
MVTTPKKTKKSELQAIGNIPAEIKIGSKKYPIKSPSIGVSSLVAQRLKVIFDELDFHPEKYDKESVTLQKIVGDLVQGIYTSIMNQKNDALFDAATEVIALIVNNKPLDAKDAAITPDEVKWGLELSEFTGFLWKILEMSDLSNFLMLLLRVGQNLDLEGALSDTHE